MKEKIENKIKELEELYDFYLHILDKYGSSRAINERLHDLEMQIIILKELFD